VARDWVRFVGVGDVNLQGRADPGAAFHRVAAELSAADVIYGNLEGPLAGADDPAPIPHKPGWVHSDPAMAAGLKAAGFTFMSCASNVAYPPSAALRSLAALDAHAIPHAGAGRTLAEAHRPAVVERGGVRFGLLSYTSVFWPHGHAAGTDSPGVATVRIATAYEPGPRVLEMPGAAPVVRTTPDPVELAAFVADITALRPQVDLLVVAMHWGISGSTELAEYQRTVGHAAVDAGADLVLGAHPHVPQGIEVRPRGDRPAPGIICYSLGNFVFDWPAMRGHADGLLVRCLLDPVRRVPVHVAFVPVGRNDAGDAELLAPNRVPGAAVTAAVTTLSHALGTQCRVHPAQQEVVIWSESRARSQRARSDID
jgi:poly-gamma-glutamate capsule biosynthesis protein CapA/YwtB (metallophosphatase superfamily)